MEKINLSILLLLLSISALAQELPENTKLTIDESTEKVFVDYNSSLVFPGEYLYYKLYLLDNRSHELSSFSKIAYVKMINERGESIFTHKISIESGTGNGDFFIPTDIASGTYKIIAYTQWMFNNNDTNYFNANVFVINPYTTKRENSVKRVADSVMVDNNLAATASPTSLISLSKKGGFNKREEIEIFLDSIQLAGGNYSLSVYRKNEFIEPGKSNIKNFYTENYSSVTSSNEEPKDRFLPELRGDLYSGRIKVIQNDISVANRSLAISVPGENFQLKISNTSEKGCFYFNLDKKWPTEKLFIQVLGEDAANFKVILDESPAFDYSDLYFPSLEIGPDMESKIISRSVHNQIENSYYSVKPDTLKVPERDDPFFGKNDIEVFYLDNYTRFPSIKETFIEVVSSARIRKDKGGKNVFRVSPLNNAAEFITSALLIVDGLYIEDTETLMNYSADKIKEIRVLRKEYYYGSKIFGGIIFIETKEKDFVNNYQAASLQKFDIIPVEPNKNYYKVDYEKQNMSRVPDFRRQLLWLPHLTNFTDLKFYTSDITGDFIITLQGIDSNGNAVFDQEEFRVN